MAIDTNKDREKRAIPNPSLEKLINTIDQQAEQVPTLSTAEGFAAFLGGRAEDYQHQGKQYVRFMIDDTTFALPLQNALEIDYVPEIVPLPNLPQWVLGICNLRGDIVSVVDLRQILQLAPGNLDAVQKLVLIKNKDVSTAIIVDHISGMLITNDQEEDTNNDFETAEQKPFFNFVKDVIISDRQTVHLLDLDALMTAIRI